MPTFTSSVSEDPRESIAFAQTTIAVRAKSFSVCLRRVAHLLQDVQIMVVTPNPEKQGFLQGMTLAYAALINGVFQPSGLIDQKTADVISSIFAEIPAINAVTLNGGVRSNIDWNLLIKNHQLQKGDVIAVLAIEGLCDDVRNTLNRLGHTVLVAPIYLGVYRKKSWPWIFDNTVSISKLDSLENEIASYFRQRKLPSDALASVLHAVAELQSEAIKHRFLPILPHSPAFHWHNGIF